jgi:hypothetical protein
MPTAAILKLQPRTHNQTKLEVFTARFRDAIKRSIQGILDAGAVLIDAKEQLEYGTFQDWVRNDLTIGLRQAQMLMLISRNPVFCKETYQGSFPTSWRTLYELAQIRPQKLTEFIEGGKINPTMMREDAIALRLRGQSTFQAKPKTPKLRQELQHLINAAIVLGGGDCCLHHLRSITDIRDITPSPNEITKAADWVKQRLRRQSVQEE